MVLCCHGDHYSKATSLILLLGESGNWNNAWKASSVVTPDSSAPTDDAAAHVSPTNAQARYWIESPPFEAYDPIDVGVLDEEHAYRLVQEFRTSFVSSFPFIVLDGDGPSLRRQAPFLFLAILTITAYDTPRIQCLLSEELRRQMARTIEHCRKSLDILQGLLVYGAWYHTFYRPANQQLAIIVQLCVALVQDLGLSSPAKPKPNKWSFADCGILGRPKGSLAEKRAYLGTYLLSVLFAQSWRKRTTLPYTRYLTLCCDAFRDSSLQTDALIRPLIQSCELLSRVNAHFSYDDIDNADVKGELLLDITVTSFLREKKLIQDSISASIFLQQNTTLTLMFSLLDISINEVCLHTSLWQTPTAQAAPPLSLIRVKMLHSAMIATTSYIKTLLEAPQSELLRLALSSWASWFYATIIICKLVFLEENERLGRTTLEEIPEEIDNLIPQNMDAEDISGYVSASAEISEQSGWTALPVAERYNVGLLFDRFMQKLRFILPEGDAPWHRPKEARESLYAIACIQQVILNGFTKRMDRLNSKTTTTPPTDRAPATAPNTHADGFAQSTWSSSLSDPHGIHVNARAPVPMAPFASFMNFDSINFDGVMLPQSTFPPQMGETVLGDWMWDMVMDDLTMP
ncbi:hypothetical protein EK21DRAFT_106773 [Setomelanomma holmii]|uniref:Transcription factor domain-containing protein n=1 Tax=Setomelanomma holmii TaxID=210430 RepID=A0A9P4HIM0_9PLEO|nr:hypothetical protein EK21DRAFT_106773 [Setomelanomma holmii]